MDEHASRERTQTVLRAFLVVLIVYVAIGYASNPGEDSQDDALTPPPSGEPIILGIPPTIPFEGQATFAQVSVPGLPETPAPNTATPFAPAAPQAQPSPTLALTIIPPRPASPMDGQTYTVQPGDNLFRIALRFGLSAEALAQANALTDPSLIVVGQVLRIPNTATPSPTPVSASSLFIV